jgi:uncharacterized RDD family membrane protein YckC
VSAVTDPDPASSAVAPRGARLGLPPTGPGSLASFGRRLLALFVDWFASILVTRLVTGGRLVYGSAAYSLVTLGIFALEVFALTWLAGGSFGQLVVGLRVVSLDGGRLPAWRALVRTVLICLVVPPLVWDRDGRGLHDRAVNSAVLRVR